MEHLLKIGTLLYVNIACQDLARVWRLTAEELLGYSPDVVVNFRDDDELTAIHHAVSGGDIEVQNN